MMARPLRALARAILALVVPSAPEKTNVEVDAENKVSLQCVNLTQPSRQREALTHGWQPYPQTSQLFRRPRYEIQKVKA
jgi:hypothetical protein